MAYIEKQVNKVETRLNLMKLQREQPNDNTIKVIYELVCCRIGSDNPFQNIAVNVPEFKDVDILSLTNDENIIARWCDMLLCAKENVVCNSILAYRHYITAYKPEFCLSDDL